jgi:hypothetical protein
MSKENLDAHRRGIEAFNNRDFSAFIALMDEDVEAVSQLTVMEGAYRGHDGLRRWWDDLTGTFPDWRIEIVQLRDLGDVTAAGLLAHGHGAGSEAPVRTSAWQVGRWRDGKCVWWASFESEREALEAVGVSE